jgi:aconitate hydratase
MGVIPLEFEGGQTAKSLGLSGEETYDIRGLNTLAGPKQWVEVVAHAEEGDKVFKALVRVDNETEMQYIERGGVLPYVFAKLHNSGH